MGTTPKLIVLGCIRKLDKHEIACETQIEPENIVSSMASFYIFVYIPTLISFNDAL